MLEEINDLIRKQFYIAVSLQSKFILGEARMTVPQAKDAAQALESSVNTIKILLEILKQSKTNDRFNP
jgi:hypothetical protein